MYTITGVTGHVGAAAAQELLQRNARVRAVVRDEAKSEVWVLQGAETAIADFNDRASLAQALRGSLGAFLLLPVIPGGGDSEHRQLADSIAAAVADSGVPHVVLLSAIGADIADGTGPIRWLHHLESRLRQTNVVLTAIRSWHFQEKVETILGAALEAGIYPVFGATADVPAPMIATRDIGEVVAEALLAPPPINEVIDLEGPEYTERQVASALAATLGKPLQVVTIPQPGWVDTMVAAGVAEPLAHELAELYQAEQRGLFQARGDRKRTCHTRIDETLRHVVATIANRAPAA